MIPSGCKDHRYPRADCPNCCSIAGTFEPFGWMWNKSTEDRLADWISEEQHPPTLPTDLTPQSTYCSVRLSLNQCPCTLVKGCLLHNSKILTPDRL